MDGAAFDGVPNLPRTPEHETVRVLENVRQRIMKHHIGLDEPDEYRLQDVNGNQCGRVRVEE